MAQIPVGNFGNAVANAGPQVDFRRANPLGQATERLGQIAQGAVMDNIAAQTREAEIARRKQEAEDQRLRDATERAQSIVALSRGQDAVGETTAQLQQDVLSGAVSKDDAHAEYQKRIGKALEGMTNGLAPDHKVIVDAQFQSMAEKSGGQVREFVAKRERLDVSAAIAQTLEFEQRNYGRDPAGATKRAEAVVDQLGPFSDYPPEKLAGVKQKWKEDTQFTAGYGMVSAAKTNRGQLDAAEAAIRDGLPDLDPQKKTVLLDRIQGYRLHLDQQAELAAQRAQRKEEHRLKQAEASFNTLQALADKGTILDPDYVDKAVTATTGTPYQAGIVALARQAAENGGLAAQPIAKQQAMLDSINAQIAQHGRSPELDKRKDQIEKVLRGSKSDLETDGLRAGLERGVITEIPPIDITKGPAGIIEALRARAPLADRVSRTWAGKPVSPLTADEAAMVKQQIDSLAPKDRAGFIAAMAQGIGPGQAQGLAMQMDKQDRGLGLAFALAGDKTTMGRYTSELLLRGQQAKKDGTSTKGEKSPEIRENQWKAWITTELGDAYGVQSTTNDVRDAAVLIAHGIAAENGGALSKRDMARAVALAAGGDVVEHNGRKIPLPAGIEQADLERRLSSVTPDEIARQAPGGSVIAGGVQIPLAQFVESLPGQQLMPVSKGRYAVLVNGRPVTNGSGEPIVIGVR